jgi:hypothetical protein
VIYRLASIVALLLTGCESPEPDLPSSCGEGDLFAEFVPKSEVYGDFVDGTSIFIGLPPQGGSPFTPLQLRVSGMSQNNDGLDVRLVGVDKETGELLGQAEYNHRFFCSNVGVNEGYWVTSELHMRYPGWSLEELQDREIELVIQTTNTDGDTVDAHIEGVLRQ